MGAHVLGIKDMAGLCRPYAAEQLVKALKQEIGIPDPLPHARHERPQRGVGAEGGRGGRGRGGRRRRVDERHDQPAESELASSRRCEHTPRDTGSTSTRSTSSPTTGKPFARIYAPFDTAPLSGTAEVYLHEMPGGQYTNLQRAGRRRWAWATAGRRSRAPTPR